MEHEGQEDVRNLKFIRLRGSYCHLQGSDTVWSAKWTPSVSEEYSAFTFSVDGGRNTTENLVTAQEIILYRMTHTTKWQNPSVFTTFIVSWDSDENAGVCLGPPVARKKFNKRRKANLFLCLSNTQWRCRTRSNTKLSRTLRWMVIFRLWLHDYMPYERNPVFYVAWECKCQSRYEQNGTPVVNATPIIIISESLYSVQC